MEIVINRCFGGFSLSEEACEYLGIPCESYGYEYKHCYENRTDRKLIDCVKTLGGKANGPFAELKIVEIPDDIEWIIDDYDGMETVAEKHKVWY